MARPVFDSVGGADASGSTGRTYDHNPIGGGSTGSDLYMVVGVVQRGSGSNPPTVSQVLVDGVAFTQLKTVLQSTVRVRVDLWGGVISPTVNSVEVDLSGSAAKCLIVSLAYRGVDGSNPTGTAVSTSGTSAAPTSPSLSSSDQETLVDVLGWNYSAGGAATPNAAQTQEQQLNTTGGTDAGIAMSDKPGAASTTMSWSITSAGWAICAVPLKGTPQVIRNFPHTPVFPLVVQ